MMIMIETRTRRRIMVVAVFSLHMIGSSEGFFLQHKKHHHPPHHPQHTLLSPCTDGGGERISFSWWRHSVANDNTSGGNEKDDDDDDDSSSNNKPSSRLALLAEDWLLEEEENDDELTSYWNRFEENKQQPKKGNTTSNSTAGPAVALEEDDVIQGRSTDQLMKDYYQSRNIDIEVERAHRQEIQAALETAQRTMSHSPASAVRALEAVQPYLQIYSRLGGTTFLQLAKAYSNVEDYEKALSILVQLQEHPQVDLRQQAKLEWTNVRSDQKRKQTGNLWEKLFQNRPW